MRVFISSTVYDLIDVRAELSEQLMAIGITPVLSDDKLSDFYVRHDINSIETCLVNVESCDEIILILDKRYGPTLEKYGYESFSATHLEYKRAIEKKIPVQVYIRDRLEADFTIWKRNNRRYSKILPWVSKKDVGLFEFLDDHARLHANLTTSNWYTTFTNSIDLKASITKHFEKRVLPERLVEAIQNNIFPLFNIEVEASPFGSNHQFKFIASLTNISRVPAFNFNVFWDDQGRKVEKDSIFSPGQSIQMSFLWRGDPSQTVEKFLIAEYESPIGISVRDRFCISGRIGCNVVISGGRLDDRKFRRSAGVLLEIENI